MGLGGMGGKWMRGVEGGGEGTGVAARGVDAKGGGGRNVRKDGLG